MIKLKWMALKVPTFDNHDDSFLHTVQHNTLRLLYRIVPLDTFISMTCFVGNEYFLETTSD